MAIRFAMSGGNFILSQGQSVSGIWLQTAGTGITSTAPAGRADTYAFTGSTYRTPNLGGNYAGLVAGMSFYNNSNGFSGNQTLIAFFDGSVTAQCSLVMNGSGQLFFTRNGTPIGATSTYALIPSAWQYIEFKALFSTTGTGTCEARVNSVVVVSSTGLTNATTTATGAVCQFQNATAVGTSPYLKDFYVVDTASGTNTNYLGDVNVIEVFPNGPGTNQQWTANVGPFTLTSVNGAGVYQGTITGGASNAYQGYNFNVTGFTNGANNVTGVACTASSATSLTLAAATAVETHAGSAAFQAIVQPGINQTGTRPNQDATYLSDATAGDISDFTHQPISLTGNIIAVVQQSYLRKDDAGARSVQQWVNSSGAVVNSSSISLGNTYSYYQNILENDPNTSMQWSVSGLNSATFGIKEIT